MDDEKSLPSRNFPFQFVGALHAWSWVERPEAVESELDCANQRSSTPASCAAEQHPAQRTTCALVA